MAYGTMQLKNVQWLLPRCLALALWLLSGDALGQGITTRYGGEPRSIERLPSWLQGALRAVPETREVLASIDQSNDYFDGPAMELFLAARDMDEVLRAEEMVRGYPARIAYGVVSEAHSARRFVWALFSHGSRCGSAGCSIRILMHQAGRWQLAGEALGDYVSVARGRESGYPVFVVHSRGDRCSYRWNGARYWHSSGCRDW